MSEPDNRTISTAVIVRPANLPTVQEMRNKLEERRAVRALLLTYLKEEMTEGQHFGTISGTNAPMLYQDGARLVQTIFDVTSGKPELDEEYGEDGHYRCTATVPLVSLATGEILYYGMGTCSTHESKYAHRWVYESDVPIDIDKASLKSVTRNNKPPRKGTYTRYLLPNPDLGDLHHTILTMALKRADTRATMKLPSVGDIFMEPDAKENEEEDDERSTVLEKLRAWFRTCPLEVRDSVASSVFRVRNQKALSELATDMLAEGLAILETADLHWASPTLSSDYKAWQKAKGEQSSAELFGEGQTPVAHFVPEEKELAESLGTTSVKLYEDRPQEQSMAHEEMDKSSLIPEGASLLTPSLPQAATVPIQSVQQIRREAGELVQEAAAKCQATSDEIWENVKALAPRKFLLRRPKDLETVELLLPQAVARWVEAQATAAPESSDDITPPVLTLDIWLAETARGKGGTAEDVRDWLKKYDPKDLLRQAVELDPFAELPECLDLLDAILKNMPILSTVDAASETQHTPV